VKSTGSYINGNTNGSVTFKIRENNDDGEFKTNLEDCKTKLKEMGMNIGLSNKSTLKKL
jgi:hypothetical protein